MNKEGRLTKPREYSRVYSKGGSWVSRLLVLRALPGEFTVSRYGISVSKRVGNAVIRNRIKRRLKEILRAETLKPGWDIVFIVRPPASEADFSKLRDTVRNLLTRADILEETETTGGEPDRI